MENMEIARVFEEIADLLEIKGENVFRIRSYRNAALVVEGLPVALKALYEKGPEGLDGIPGIGAHTKEKIIELLTAGKCKYHQELLKEFPPGLFELLKVSGIGPKKAALLYKELGIKNLADLEKAATGHRLRELPSMGERTEEKILKAIQDLKARGGRFKVSVVKQYADAFTKYLKELPGVYEAVPSGSFRRWKEDIGDLDILVTCKDPHIVMEKFVSYSDVKEIVARGETKSTVVLKIGLQVDVRVLEKKAFGAALQYFTGSKAHNVALRNRAKRMGLKINEYGVFQEKGEKWVAGRTEEEVYKAVGLPWIPPELREDRGELDAAENGKLPIQLELKHIKGDFHAHTKESDGGFTMEEMARAAIAKGYEYLAITDHSKAVGIAHGLDEARALAQIVAIDELNEGFYKQGIKFRLLNGTEVDIRADGSLDHPAKLLEKFDCVVGAIHSGFNMPIEQMTKRIITGIRSGYINILAHPTGRIIGVRAPYPVDMEKVVDEAAKHGVALELNSYPDRLDINDVYCRLAKERGVLVAISTDSHSINHLDNMSYGIHMARRGWLEPEDVLNTRSLIEILELFSARKHI